MKRRFARIVCALVACVAVPAAASPSAQPPALSDPNAVITLAAAQLDETRGRPDVGYDVIAAAGHPPTEAELATAAARARQLTAAKRSLAGTPYVLAALTDRIDEATEDAVAAKAALDQARAALVHRQLERQMHAERLAVIGAELTDARREYTTHSISLVQLMQGTMMSVVDGTQLLLLQPGEASRQQYNGELSENAAEHLQVLLRRDAARIAKSLRDQTAARRALKESEEEITRAVGAVRAAASRVRSAEGVVAQREGFLSRVAQTREYPGLDMELIVLDAYIRAARQATEIDARCGLEWWALAGVGFAESSHANGRQISANGDVVDKIIGPTLDGTNDTQLVTDSDKGALDEDAVYDHAVGPMQFTPETWRILGIDGNDDRVVNVANIYDAAATAARKLCIDRGERPLTTSAAYAEALYKYNNSKKYVARVMTAAREMQRSGLLPTRSVSIVGGALTPTQSNALVGALGTREHPAQVIAAGPAWVAYAALQPGEEQRPPVVAGTIVIAADARWSPKEQVAILKAGLQNGGGLPILWLPAADSAVPPELDALAVTSPTVRFGPAIAEPAADPVAFAAELARLLTEPAPE